MACSAVELGNGSNRDQNLDQKSAAKDKQWRSLADLFRRHRMKVDLSLEDLSRRLEGVTADQLRAYEAGETPVPLEEIFSLTNALNIPPEEVMAILYDSSERP